MLRQKKDWEAIYDQKMTPWDANLAEPYIVKLVMDKTIKPCNVLDIGCGTGNESVFLVKNGFTVSALDISESAIKIASEKAKKENVKINFSSINFLDLVTPDKFDFILDRACFHFFDKGERPNYVRKVQELLKVNGLFLLIVSSDQESFKNVYQFSKQDILQLFKDQFEIKSIELLVLETHGEKPIPYVCQMVKKGN